MDIGRRALVLLLVAACGESSENPTGDTGESSGTSDTTGPDSGASDSDGLVADASTTTTGEDVGTSEGVDSSTSTDDGLTTTATGDESSSDDAGSTDSGEPVWTSPCPPYSGLGNVGSTWDTSTTAAYEAANGTSIDNHREITDVQEGATTLVTAVTTSESVTSTYTGTTVTTMVYACDGRGAWLQTSDSETNGISSGRPFSSWTESTYAPAWLAMPWDVQVGTEWTASSTITTTSPGGTIDTAATQSYEVTGSESVRGPAGMFDALLVSWSGSGTSGSWLADALAGAVAYPDGTYELLDVSIVEF